MLDRREEKLVYDTLFAQLELGVETRRIRRGHAWLSAYGNGHHPGQIGKLWSPAGSYGGMF